MSPEEFHRRVLEVVHEAQEAGSPSPEEVAASLLAVAASVGIFCTTLDKATSVLRGCWTFSQRQLGELVRRDPTRKGDG